MPMRDELPPVPTRPRARALAVAPSRVRQTILHGELQVIVAVCVIGYLTALNVMLRLPDLGSLLAAYSIY